MAVRIWIREQDRKTLESVCKGIQLDKYEPEKPELKAGVSLLEATLDNLPETLMKDFVLAEVGMCGRLVDGNLTEERKFSYIDYSIERRLLVILTPFNPQIKNIVEHIDDSIKTRVTSTLVVEEGVVHKYSDGTLLTMDDSTKLIGLILTNAHSFPTRVFATYYPLAKKPLEKDNYLLLWENCKKE